jgi:hypothetical protein
MTAPEPTRPTLDPNDFIPDPALLRPELRMWLFRSSRIGLMLKHPLVCQVPFYAAPLANKQYEYVLPIVQDLEKKKEFLNTLSVFYQRYHRLPKLYEWFRDGRLNVTRLRKLLAFAWPDTEDPPYADCLEMFETAGFTTDTRKRLPKGMLTLYRGDTKRRYNMEWSLQRQTAEWFARRWNPKTSWVATTQVPRDAALAYFVGRGEAEVIVNPASITKVSYEKLPAPGVR